MTKETLFNHKTEKMAYEEAYCNYDDYIPEDAYFHEDKSCYEFTEEEINEAYKEIEKSGWEQKYAAINQRFINPESANGLQTDCKRKRSKRMSLRGQQRKRMRVLL